jgi:hypothetical protein
MKESPLFVKTHDLLIWLIPHTLGFPKSQRGVLAKRLQATAFQFYELLVDAALSENPLIELRQADATLIKLRGYLRLAKEWQLLTLNQYEHVSRLVIEVGRLLGGWRRPLEKTVGAAP